MREILFRGKRCNNGEWAEGCLIRDEFCNTDIPYIGYLSDYDIGAVEVTPETVGQFTGLTDKNGKKIFEGDIIEWFLPEVSEYPSLAYIEYDEASFAWRVCWKKYDPDWLEGFNKEYISVIGNIHDNPELLENP